VSLSFLNATSSYGLSRSLENEFRYNSEWQFLNVRRLQELLDRRCAHGLNVNTQSKRLPLNSNFDGGNFGFISATNPGTHLTSELYFRLGAKVSF